MFLNLFNLMITDLFGGLPYPQLRRDTRGCKKIYNCEKESLLKMQLARQGTQVESYRGHKVAV